MKALVMGHGENVSSCCSAPVTVEGATTRYHVCMWCERACDAASVLKVLQLGEAAQAVPPGGNLSLWSSFGDVAVAYGDKWVGPGVAEMRKMRGEMADEGRYSIRAYEEFRELWHRKRGLPVPDAGRER